MFACFVAAYKLASLKRGNQSIVELLFLLPGFQSRWVQLVELKEGAKLCDHGVSCLCRPLEGVVLILGPECRLPDVLLFSLFL